MGFAEEDELLGGDVRQELTESFELPESGRCRSDESMFDAVHNYKV